MKTKPDVEKMLKICNQLNQDQAIVFCLDLTFRFLNNNKGTYCEFAAYDLHTNISARNFAYFANDATTTNYANTAACAAAYAAYTDSNAGSEIVQILQYILKDET